MPTGVVTVPTIDADGRRRGHLRVAPTGPYVGDGDVDGDGDGDVGGRLRVGDPMPAGWTRVDATTATFTVTLVGGVVCGGDAGGADGGPGGVCRWGG